VRHVVVVIGVVMSDHTDLLVIGAGPYAYAAAAYARDRGIRTHIVGIPMAFWREQMPTDMYLRSGPDWHLDVSGADTFAAYFEDRGLRPEDFDPVPISVFLDHTDWFAERKKLDVDERMVDTLTKPNGTFVATMEDGSAITADHALAVPGIRHFVNLPGWYDDVPPDRRSHTSELVSFDDLAGARVVIIGGRQSAYEWAALLCDHGAERVDLLHRHATPTFAKVSWAFVDPYVEQTVAQRGWWRRLPPEEQTRIAQEFWQVGRLTLEHWIVPRLLPDVVTSHPNRYVTAAASGVARQSAQSGDAEVRLTLSDGSTLTADHVVFASGYRADLARVPYLSGVIDQISVTDGFPDLSGGFETSLPGLWITGFASTRDFGPFYGFTKGCPSSARIAVDEMLA
jgi:thioredoxin reductase